MTIEVQNAVTDEELELQLPKPVGYKLLIALPQVEETIGDMGIIKAQKTIHEEMIMTVTGLVLDMGAQAYSDKDRYPNGPWCKVGDYVRVPKWGGDRWEIDFEDNGIKGKALFTFFNDHEIIGMVTGDPRDIKAFL